MKNLLFALLLALGAGFVFTACDRSPAEDPIKGTIETIRANPDLSTFLAALERSDLTSRLDSGSLTLFAPSNAAFTTFLTANGYQRLEDVPVANLKQILLYHVTSGIVRAENIPQGYLASLANFGLDLNVKLFFRTVGDWLVSGVPVVQGGIHTTEGLVYIVDRVVPLPDLIKGLQNDPAFSTFLLALTRSDLDIDYLATLSGPGPFTVLAPTDPAFAELFAELGYANLDAIPKDALNAILQYHVVPAVNLTRNDIGFLSQVTSLSGKKITIDPGYQFTDTQGRTAAFTRPDIQTSNGVIHAISKVLLPN